MICILDVDDMHKEEDIAINPTHRRHCAQGYCNDDDLIIEKDPDYISEDDGDQQGQELWSSETVAEVYNDITFETSDRIATVQSNAGQGHAVLQWVVYLLLVWQVRLQCV